MFNVYQNKRVLITGNTGFKGAWLTTWLLKLGAKVGGLSLDIPSTPSVFETLQLEKEIDHYWGDIRNNDFVQKTLKTFKPEFVFHLAAQPIVSVAYQDPQKTFETNVMGMVNILQAIRETDSVRAAVLITSDKCYENVEWPYGYRERDRLGGKDPYSASKGCAELVAHAYWHSFIHEHPSVKMATTRAGNVIGGGDWAVDRLVPDIIRAWREGRELSIRAPHATRPWQHVLEPLSGYLCLGEKLYQAGAPYNGQAYNFGPREGMMKSVLEVVKTFEPHWPRAEWAIHENANLKECSLLKLDCSKAHHELQWRAALDFDQTIAFTAAWYRYYHDKVDCKQLSLKQIDDYTQLAKARGIAWAM